MTKYNWKKDVLRAREQIGRALYNVESARAGVVGKNDYEILGITCFHLQESRLLIDRLSRGWPEDGNKES